MKFLPPLIFATVFFLLNSCAIFDAKQSGQTSVMSPNYLVLPVSKNWQAKEEAPKLSNERECLPFQLEQSVQPKEAKPVSTEKNYNIDAPRLPTAHAL